MKAKKQPILEAISPAYGSSLKVVRYAESCNSAAAAWHFHPEMEIVYVDGGAGKRHIGNHISYYQDGDLIFIGANLPHYGFTDRLTGHTSEVVIQAKESILSEDLLLIPEMSEIQQLLKRSRQGIIFHGQTKTRVGEKIKALPEMAPYRRLIAFLDILGDLAESQEYTLLNVDQVVLESKPQDTQRLDHIYALVREEFTRPISLSEVAELVNMTDQAFSRYFKQKTGKTFTRFVNEYRLVHACKLLAEDDMSITDVCFASGFNNFSHFNKKFKEYTGNSPSHYRNALRKVVE